MKHEFSDNLVKRLQEYFHSKHGVEVSDEEAETYLSSIADLYSVFAQINSESKSRSATDQSDGSSLV